MEATGSDFAFGARALARAPPARHGGEKPVFDLDRQGSAVQWRPLFQPAQERWPWRSPSLVSSACVGIAERNSTISLEEAAEAESKAGAAKATPADVEGEDEEVEIAGGAEDDTTFLEQDEEESSDVSDLIGEGIEEKEEEN